MELHNLPTQMTLNWKPRFKSLRSIWVVMLSKPTWLLGITCPCWGEMVEMGDIAVAIVLEALGEAGCIRVESR